MEFSSTSPNNYSSAKNMASNKAVADPEQILDPKYLSEFAIEHFPLKHYKSSEAIPASNFHKSGRHVIGLKFSKEIPYCSPSKMVLLLSLLGSHLIWVAIISDILSRLLT